ncbi:GILT-like protein F37H8.5 [Durio zibethinus]|uniref:GILT-like protein F37H8.5 n=1 Tax=Durio zibethinus TaxID=66656 RepID=A0A6P5Z640_DURZI|nr:GILT-like protein F37H8.5 [Durio zibethinus]
MAYLQLFFFIIVASLPFMFVSPSHSSLDYGNVKTLSHAKNNEKVTLSLYYETLCPYCASFISDDLVKVFQSDLNTIVNLRLVPWDNALIVNNRTLCQVRCPFFF